jgi:hypothetical protein
MRRFVASHIMAVRIQHFRLTMALPPSSPWSRTEAVRNVPNRKRRAGEIFFGVGVKF